MKSGTKWTTADIWLRREFTMPERRVPDLQFLVYHDEDVEIYVNGVLAASAGGYNNEYEPMEISKAARGAAEAGGEDHAGRPLPPDRSAARGSTWAW